MQKSENSSFCSLFWNHLYTGPDGKIWPCCKFNRFEDVDRIDFETISEQINEPFLIELRKKSVNGQKISGCRRCYDDEASNKTSMREMANAEMSQSEIDTIISIAKDNECRIENFKPNYIFPFLTNECNSACRSCNPTFSNRIAKEALTLGDPVLERFEMTITGVRKFKVQNHINTKILPKLINERLFNDCEKIRYAGGEPFITKDFYYLIDYLISSDLAKNITLDISSNMSIKSFNNINCIKFIEKCCDNFKNVILTCSIDSFNKSHFDFIRFGSNFLIVLDNLERLKNLKSQKMNLTINFAVVISVLNVLYLDEINDFYLRNYSEISTIDYQFLSFPEYLNIKILPPDSINTKFMKHQIESFLQTPLLKSKEERLLQFIQFSEIFDKQRNQDWKSTFPELHEIIKNFDK